MFARIVGRRATALATTLAVVVGLAITPAFTATAAEGDPVEVVEPAAPVVAPEAAPVAQAPVEAPVAAVEEPAIQEPSLPLAAEFRPMAAPAAGPEIQPATIGPFVVNQALPHVKFDYKGANGWAVTGLPTGLSINGGGVLEGTVSTAGTYTVVVSAQECKPKCVTLQSRTYNLTVSLPATSAPSITTSALDDATVDVTYSQQLVADGVGPMNFRLSSGNLPAGLTISTTGLISGTPTFEDGYDGNDTFQFSVIANNGRDSVAKQLSITVRTPAPAFGTTPLATASVDVPYTQALPITTGYGTLTYSLLAPTSLPTGLTLSSDGVITGTPVYAATYSGTQNIAFDVRVTGPTGSSVRTFVLTLQVSAPTITTTTLPEAWLTETYSQPITTAGPSVSLTTSRLPAGLRLEGNRDTGYAITGTPTAFGLFSVVLTGKNAGGEGTATIVLMVNEAPAITTIAVPPGKVGTAYSTVIKATGKDVSFSATSSLPGVQISATGELTWAFTGQRTGTVEVTATNRSGTVSKTFRLDSYILPTILTTDLGFGVVGTALTPSVDFTGRSSEVTVTAGALPTGLSMFKTGKFKGEPTAPGTYSFEVTVTNPVGTHSRLFEVTVYDVPVIHASSLNRAVVGQAYTDEVSFSGLGADATVVRGSVPTGMSLNTDGTFSGTPFATGVFRFTVEVRNLAGSVREAYRIVSFGIPAFATTTLSAGVVGGNYSAQLVADGHMVRFALASRSALPAGLTLDADGSIHGTPTAAGDYTFDVRARNFADTTVKTFTMSITQPVVQLSAPSIIRGNSVTVSGSGYLPGDDLELWLHSQPVLLGTVAATNGTFTSTVVIPANTEAGAHHLVVTGAKSGTQSVPLTVALPAPAVVPAAPQSNPQSAVQPRGSQQAAAALEDSATVSESTAIEEPEAPAEEEVEAELETLDQPVADGEKPAQVADLTGLMVGAFALLLAAMLVLFLLWRRRRAAES